METKIPTGYRYFLVFIDDNSRFTFVRLIKSKAEVTNAVKDLFAIVTDMRKNQWR